MFNGFALFIKTLGRVLQSPPIEVDVLASSFIMHYLVYTIFLPGSAAVAQTPFNAMHARGIIQV